MPKEDDRGTNILGEWYKKVGDQVHVGDVLFTYETDKAVFEYSSEVEGFLLDQVYEAGDVVPVLNVVCHVGGIPFRRDDQSWDLSNLSQCVGIAAGKDYLACLSINGTVQIEGKNKNQMMASMNWENIITIKAGKTHLVGLKDNGTVAAVGDESDGKCDVDGWKLFETEEEKMEREREEALKAARRQEEEEQRLREKAARKEQEEAERKAREEQKSQWRSAGLCQHCGGSFKGLFTKKCTSCGKPKDY